MAETATAKDAQKKKKRKPKKTLKGISINAVKMDYALNATRDRYGQAGELSRSIMFKSGSDKLTLMFSCGDTVDLSLKGLKEIVAYLEQGDVQDGENINEFFAR